MQGKEHKVTTTSGKNKLKTDTVLKNFWRDNARFYGEKAWDGPLSLKDMLNIPEKLKPVINDYKMNLIQVRESDQFRLRNPDVQTVFDVSRNIFKKNYEKIEGIYREQEIDSELGIVIGTITESKEFINHALERKGGRMNMCAALEELKNECKQEGRKEGIQEGRKEGIQEGKIAGFIEASKVFGVTKEEVAEKILKTYGLDAEETAVYLEKYW